MADAAAKDAAGPAAAADRLAAADAWWKAADADPVRKTLLQRRAPLRYDRALPDLDDKDEGAGEDGRDRAVQDVPGFR